MGQNIDSQTRPGGGGGVFIINSIYPREFESTIKSRGKKRKKEKKVLYTSSYNLKRMCLCIKDPTLLSLLEAHRYIVRKDEIEILQDLREPEALLVVVPVSAVRLRHIDSAREPGARSTSRVDRLKRIPCPIAILLVSGDHVRVVIALDDLRTENIVAARHIESVLLEEGELGGIRQDLGPVPREPFGADVGGGRGVGVMAAGSEGDTVVDVVLSTESLPTENEVTADEAG